MISAIQTIHTAFFSHKNLFYLSRQPIPTALSIFRSHSFLPFSNSSTLLSSRIWAHSSAATPKMLKFPGEREIISYLTNHYLTKPSCPTQQRILETIALAFSDSSEEESNLPEKITKSLSNLDQQLGLSKLSATALKINLASALTDCAHGKPNLSEE